MFQDLERLKERLSEMQKRKRRFTPKARSGPSFENREHFGAGRHRWERSFDGRREPLPHQRRGRSELRRPMELQRQKSTPYAADLYRSHPERGQIARRSPGRSPKDLRKVIDSNRSLRAQRGPETEKQHGVQSTSNTQQFQQRNGTERPPLQSSADKPPKSMKERQTFGSSAPRVRKQEHSSSEDDDKRADARRRKRKASTSSSSSSSSTTTSSSDYSCDDKDCKSSECTSDSDSSCSDCSSSSDEDDQRNERASKQNTPLASIKSNEEEKSLKRKRASLNGNNSSDKDDHRDGRASEQNLLLASSKSDELDNQKVTSPDNSGNVNNVSESDCIVVPDITNDDLFSSHNYTPNDCNADKGGEEQMDIDARSQKSYRSELGYSSDGEDHENATTARPEDGQLMTQEPVNSNEPMPQPQGNDYYRFIMKTKRLHCCHSMRTCKFN